MFTPHNTDEVVPLVLTPRAKPADIGVLVIGRPAAPGLFEVA
jgi:hypothetical protein